MSNNPTASDPWRSARLIYRAVETPDDDEFFMELASHPDDFQNFSPQLAKPQGRKDVKEYQDFIMNKCLAAIMICLPAPAESEETTGDAWSGGKTNTTPASNTVPVDKPNQTTTETPKPKPKPIPIGVLDLTNPDPRETHHRRTQIGINIAKAHQSKGYGTEALNWALDFGFRTAGLNRMGIAAFAWNEGAVRLYERLGFKEEGRVRQAFWCQGRFWDEVLFGMLVHEWKALRGET